ncbi:MAG: hypothetical protein K2J93_03655 [Anaeroplasmataceae bacterium]|nr:hypothetical protein [Anaeroplasmataceae bacterium]
MNNLFQIQYDKTTKKSIAQYDSFIIRRVSKKQEEQLNSMGQSYKTRPQNNELPRWLSFMNRIAFYALLVSFIFLISLLLNRSKENQGSFLNNSIWIIIILSIAAGLFIITLIIAIFIKKKNEKQNPEVTSQSLFNSILETSKEYLSIPASAKSLEVLMEQPNKKSKEKKMYSNILLSVFVENDMLCLADLYVVIGIPIKNLEDFKIIEEPYRFSFWHKKNSFREYGVKLIPAPVRCYQKDQYSILEIHQSKEDLAIFIPEYEVFEFRKILEEKREEE